MLYNKYTSARLVNRESTQEKTIQGVGEKNGNKTDAE